MWIEEVKLPFTVESSTNWYTQFGKLAVSTKNKNKHNLGPGNSTPKQPNRNVCIYSPRRKKYVLALILITPNWKLHRFFIKTGEEV